jgi:hypothetical protein
MKREKRLTKRERKAQQPPRPQVTTRAAQPRGGGEQHIHCVACGRHLDPGFFDPPATAGYVRCAHGSTFAACVTCTDRAQELLAEHDRTGQPVKAAAAWH